MRNASLRLLYNGTDISADIAGDVVSFRCTSAASDEADVLDVTLADPDKKWLTRWMPQAGDKLTAAVRLTDWKRDGDSYTIQCGTYILDEPSYSAPPRTQTLSAVSHAVNSSLVSAQRSRTWTDAAISEIAAQIASENGLALYWDSTYDPHITMEQTKTADMEFISQLCADYTLRLKVADGQIVIYDPLPRESAPPVCVLRESGDLTRYRFRHTYLETGYTDAEVTTVDSETGEYHMMEDTARYQGLTEEEAYEKYGKTLTTSAEEITTDPELAARKLKVEKMKEYTAEISCMILPELHEGSAVTLSGFGNWDGAWIADSVTIALPAGTMSVSLHKAVIE